MPVIARQGSTNELLKKMGGSGMSKEYPIKMRDGLLTERGRAGTLSPSNPESDKRLSGAF